MPTADARITAPSPAPTPSVARTCGTILELLLPHRRASEPNAAAPASAFPHQLRRLAAFVAHDEPIVLTLPGFPCKSPNPAKVLGHLPDEGERLSLTFLDTLCAEIQKVHAPGARLVICSDGHVFGDLIGVPDEHIDAYSDALSAMIRREELDRLDTFDLRDVLGDLPYDVKRARVHEEYAPTLDALRAEVHADEHTLRLYRGITRFLVDDATGFPGTRSALQRECRRRAYGVIQRSRAWGDLIAAHHPRSVRLSIHPQPAGAAKFGIRLLDSRDVWTTPWHASALRQGDGSWELMPRSRAEGLGRLVRRDGAPSHFESDPPAN
ncbi:L-tyrosine/L-tryptophan isonitrile synthase family protein [Streptomyces lunaelactis]|uniref:L-tyrosine/L-tryptophan isonitrile synthase family protein n=1 Tax=Streptomyces lunaelactis TaxID=1535768 RepID=UPI0015844F2B|nr:isocyanide synthase family protein [Streptomyces lunaelactis]NUK22421.1 L-tyrosine/L-tryptophan isonitrile synthase family protein [Streptomyces lunaelactis]